METSTLPVYGLKRGTGNSPEIHVVRLLAEHTVFDATEHLLYCAGASIATE